jgi:hypothetical protein
MGGGFYHLLMKKKLYLTCGNCQLICTPEREERKRRFKSLTESGVVIQNQDGSLEVLSPQAANERMASLPANIRVLYEDDPAVQDR